MKFLKILGIIILSLVLAILLAGIILPKEARIERSITVNDSVHFVYDYMRNMKNMQAWSPWSGIDPDMEISYTGTDGEIGSQYLWKGDKNVGKGYQEITKLAPGERIDIKLVFIEPWESESEVYFLYQDLEGETVVTWGYYETLPIPKNIMMAAMSMQKKLGNDFDKGLARLKEVIETNK